MKILVWNVRGLNHPLKQKEVVGRIRRLNANLVCLLETRIKQNKMQNIFNRQFSGWKLLHNYTEAYNGRIWFLWKDTLQVNLIASTSQSITCSIMKDAQQFYFSAVYGSNDGVERRRLWSHLYSLNTIMSAEPWLIAGDFNVILHPSESSNEHQGFTSDMRDFMESKVKISVFDHAFSSPLFTWSNRQLDGFLARKLDSVLINGDRKSVV